VYRLLSNWATRSMIEETTLMECRSSAQHRCGPTLVLRPVKFVTTRLRFVRTLHAQRGDDGLRPGRGFGSQDLPDRSTRWENRGSEPGSVTKLFGESTCRLCDSTRLEVVMKCEPTPLSRSLPVAPSRSSEEQRSIHGVPQCLDCAFSDCRTLSIQNCSIEKYLYNRPFSLGLAEHLITTPPPSPVGVPLRGVTCGRYRKRTMAHS